MKTGVNNIFNKKKTTCTKMTKLKAIYFYCFPTVDAKDAYYLTASTDLAYASAYAQGWLTKLA